MTTTVIETSLELVNNSLTPQEPVLVVAVNADGTAIGGGGSGGGDVNLNEVGGAAFALGHAVSAASLSVTVATDQTAIPTNLADVGGTAVTLGQKAITASIPVVIASNQTAVPISGSITNNGTANAIASVHINGSEETVAFGPTTGFLTGLQITAIDPVDPGGSAILDFNAATGGALDFALTLPALTVSAGAGFEVMNLTGLHIPVAAGGFSMVLTTALTSGMYQVSGSFSPT